MRKSLNGIWKLNSSFLKEKDIFDLKCQVPGSIYNDLLKNKIIDDQANQNVQNKEKEK